MRPAAAFKSEPALGGRESCDKSRANPAPPAAAAAAIFRGDQRATGRGRELPAGLHGCGRKHGQFYGADQELGAIALQVLFAEVRPGHEAALPEERLRDLQ